MNEQKSVCCNAGLIGGTQCEACGADGRPKQVFGYLVISVTHDAFEKAARHVRDFKEKDASEVVIMYEGEKVEMTMREFLEAVGFENTPCETCDGTGEVTVNERVYPGEPHVAPIGTERCPDCQINEPDSEPDDDR